MVGATCIVCNMQTVSLTPSKIQITQKKIDPSPDLAPRKVKVSQTGASHTGLCGAVNIQSESKIRLTRTYTNSSAANLPTCMLWVLQVTSSCVLVGVRSLQNCHGLCPQSIEIEAEVVVACFFSKRI